MSVKVSVLMPVYNTGEKYLKEAIESILNQTFSDFELLIGDDGSEKNIEEIIKSYSDSRIKYHKFEHRGISQTRNNLIDLAQGKYIAWMDSDDISTKNRLEIQYNFLEKNPDISLCGGQSINFDENGEIKTTTLPLKLGLFEYGKFSQGTSMARLKDINKFQLRYDATFEANEDPEFYSRAFRYLKGENVNEILLKYRILNNSLSHNKEKDNKRKTMRRKECDNFYSYLTADEAMRWRLWQAFNPPTLKERFFSVTNANLYSHKCKCLRIFGLAFLIKRKNKNT